VAEAWSTLGIYQKIKLLDHLPAHFTCILFDRRECGQSGGRSPGGITSRKAKGCSSICTLRGRISWVAAWAAHRL
jgi:hypothetical protein